MLKKIRNLSGCRQPSKLTKIICAVLCLSLTAHGISFGDPESQQRFLQETNQSAEIKPIYLNEYYSETLEGPGSNDQWAYFSLVFADQKTNSTVNFKDSLTDLVIQAQRIGDKFTDPNLYIRHGDNLPTLFQYDFKCSFYGEDFCIINSKELKNKEKITIGVYCNDECEFKLQAELTQELYFSPGRSYKLYFMENQERVIRFNIPDDPEIHTVEIKGINENKYDKFSMIMSKGNNLPASDNALYLRPAWENGYVGKFVDDCSCFCKGCNYTVLVSSQKAGYITVGSKVSGQVMDLTSSNGEIYDSVLYHHSQCYSYKVNNGKKDLRIRIESYAGDPNIYVNPFKKPSDVGQSQFNSRDHFENEELILTPEERKKYNASIGEYYICIFGNTAATYKLTVKNEDHDIFLKTGLSESGYIQPNETQVFYFRDPILAAKDVDLEFQLHVMTGSARLRAKLCPVGFNDTYDTFKANCTYTQYEMLEEDPEEKFQMHLGAESKKTDTEICKMPEKNSRNKDKVSCVFVVGVIGMAEFQTHFSVMTKTNRKADYVILKEGVPSKGEIKETEPKYFLVSINNPNVTKVSFQLTTIHGDPDLYISRNQKEPTQYDFEKRSTRCGIYPDIITFTKDEDQSKKLDADYYIAIFGYVQSTFSLVYFVETTEGTVSKVKLLTGQKQKGILKSTSESMVYFFKISNEVKEDVEVRLHSENGHFKIFLGKNFVPGETNFTHSGDEHSPIIFKQDPSKNSFQNYYVRVVPQQFSFSQNQSKDSAGMAFVYTIGFYEQGTFIHLVEGISQRGVVNNKTFDYYYIDIRDKDKTYEVTLTAIDGNPDLVISLDSENKFPDKDSNDFISESAFAADSITIDSDQIQAFESKTGKKVAQIYVGVYTESLSSTFTILATVKDEFKPVLLTNGQIQQGVLEVNETKYYYFKTGSSMPIYATLAPKQGNPDLSLVFIKNLSQSMYEWKQYEDLEPAYESKEALGGDIIFLNTKDQKFTKSCGSSCILLIKVSNNNSKVESRYTIQISRDIQELAANVQVNGQIEDKGLYKYYKFFKSCDDCDLQIDITPQQIYNNLILLVEHNITTKLPTDENYPRWKLNANQESSLVIPSDDPLFKNKSSKGLYVIGVHALQNASYLISVQTTPHFTEEQRNQNQYLSIRKIYLGETLDLNFQPQQVRYFYFENWRNSSIKFRYVPGSSSPLYSRYFLTPFDFKITTVDSKKLPTKIDQLTGNQWLVNKPKNNYSSAYQNSYVDTIKVNQQTQGVEFCVQCYYIIRLENIRQDKDVEIRLQISQDDDYGNGYASNLIIGRPYTLKLAEQEKALLSFQMGETSSSNLEVTLNYFTGRARLSLMGDSQLEELFPDNSNAQRYVQQITSTQSQLHLSLQNLPPQKMYSLVVEALTDLEASLLVATNKDIQIISEGSSLKVYHNNANSNSQPTVRYLAYLPPSNKFSFAVNAKSFSITTSFNIYVKKISSGSDSRRMLYDLFKHNSQNALTQGKFKEDKESYDYIFRSNSSVDPLSLFEVLPIELGDQEDLLLLKIEVFPNPDLQLGKTTTTTSTEWTYPYYSNNTREQLARQHVEVAFSGSEIQQLPTGKTVRGHVSNRESTFKIYEVIINKESLFKNQSNDLFIEVTSCNGRVDFYVSTDYLALFKPESLVNYLDIVSQSIFGIRTCRVMSIDNLDVVYVGIESSNELYSIFKEQSESFFEVRTQIIPRSLKDLTQTYVFDKNSKEIVIEDDPKDKESIIVKWNQIYQVNSKDNGQEYQPADGASYQLYAGVNDIAMYNMYTMCSIEHSGINSVFSIFLDQSAQEQRQIILKREDLKNVKVINVIAKVHDPVTGDLISLAYEPYQFLHGQFGVKVQLYQIVLIIILAAILVIFMGVIVFCLRRKSLALQRRMKNEIHYAQHNLDGSNKVEDTSFSH